jgi:hypothetical protein
MSARQWTMELVLNHQGSDKLLSSDLCLMHHAKLHWIYACFDKNIRVIHAVFVKTPVI